MTRAINAAGLELIKRAEGLRLDAYLDSVQVPSIGYGHTAGVKLGQTITEQQAEDFLRADLADAEACVEATCPGLSDNRFSACVSFVFNLGCSAFKHSTLVKMIWAEDWDAAAAEFQRWNRAGGNVLPGLTKRRLAEAALFSEA